MLIYNLADVLDVPIPTLLNMYIPETFNDDIHIVALFDVFVPDTINFLVVNVEGFV